MPTPSVELLPTAARVRELQDDLHRALTELKTESANGDVVELARLLVHDFNNFLNNIVLSLAVLEQSGEASGASLAPLRAQAERVATMIREFHDYRHKSAAVHQRISLNDTLREVAQRLESEREHAATGHNGGRTDPAVPLSLDLAPDLPAVAAVASDFGRFAKFILRNALLIAATNDGRVHVKTTHAADTVELTIDIVGAAPSDQSLSTQFELLAAAFPGVSHLELAACSSIARRSHAKISVEARPDAGLVIHLKAPAASG